MDVIEWIELAQNKANIISNASSEMTSVSHAENIIQYLNEAKELLKIQNKYNQERNESRES